jgi:hypothetical protein
MERLGHLAFVRGRTIVVIALIATVAAAWGARDVFDVVKPFGFSDPDSESSRAYDEFEAATGEQAIPGVVLLVEAEAGSPAGQGTIADTAAELETIDGIARVLPTDDSLVSDDGNSALVVGVLESSVGDASEVGEEVEESFADDPGVTAGGTAVASHQLNGGGPPAHRAVRGATAAAALAVHLQGPGGRRAAARGRGHLDLHDPPDHPRPRGPDRDRRLRDQHRFRSASSTRSGWVVPWSPWRLHSSVLRSFRPCSPCWAAG